MSQVQNMFKELVGQELSSKVE